MKKENILKTILLIILIGSLIYTIYQGNQGEKIVYLIVVDIFLAVLLMATTFMKNIKDLIKKGKEKEPEPIDLGKMSEILYTAIQGTSKNDYKEGEFRNLKSIMEVKSVSEKNQMIYAFLIKLSGKKKLNNIEIESKYVIINSTYPNIPHLKLSGDISDEELEKRMRNMAKNYSDPDIETHKTYKDPFNRDVIEATKITHTKEEKKEEGVI